MTPSDGVSMLFMLKSVERAVTAAPISTKLFSSSTAVILPLAKVCAVLLIFTPPFILVKVKPSSADSNCSNSWGFFQAIFFCMTNFSQIKPNLFVGNRKQSVV